MTWWANFSLRTLFSPSALSILRGILGLCLPFLLLQSGVRYHLLALVLFVLAAITDYYDGWVARRFNCVTDLGKILDPTMDKVLVLVPLAVFAALGFYSPWWLVPIFVREIVITFCRVGWLVDRKAVGAEKLGKVKFVFQVAVIGFSFVYLLGLDVSLPASFLGVWKTGMMIVLYAAVLLTVISGMTFMRSNRNNFLGTAFARFVSAAGVGLLPMVPGTWGSAFGVVLIILVHWNMWLYAATFFAIVAVGYWAVSQLDLSQDRDPGFVAIDEVCGMFVTFVGIPLSLSSIVTGFFLFRLLDIVKPFPVRRLEKLPGYWGILCDDLGAGFYAWLILTIAFGLG